MDEATPNTGIVVFRDSDGIEREIDFIDAPLGLAAEDVRDTAVELTVVAEDGGTDIRFWVMHPERCMESRVINAVELGKTTQLSLRQLEASIVCAREWSRLILDDDALPKRDRVRAVLSLNERVFNKCLHDRRFRRLHAEHGIDPFGAVLVDPRLPDEFLRTRFPQMQRQLATERERGHAR